MAFDTSCLCKTASSLKKLGFQTINKIRFARQLSLQDAINGEWRWQKALNFAQRTKYTEAMA
jgi:hypothetical protein